jgi:hypothetical protein
MHQSLVTTLEATQKIKRVIQENMEYILNNEILSLKAEQELMNGLGMLQEYIESLHQAIKQCEEKSKGE